MKTNAKSRYVSRRQNLLRSLRSRRAELRRRYGVHALWLFGSYARGEQHPKSDLDLLVEFDARPLSLLKFIELENFLSDALGTKVDLVEKRALKPAIGNWIQMDLIAV